MVEKLNAMIDRPVLLIEEGSDRLASGFMNSLEAMPDFPKMKAEIASGVRADSAGFWPSPDSWMAAYRPYNVVNGVLQIPVFGVLLHRFPFTVGTWATGYEYITAAVARGVADDAVKSIVLVSDSPGGIATGGFDCADFIFSQRSKKPISAIADDLMCSAAYLVCSAASRVYTVSTGTVGSIGTVVRHTDISGMMTNAGIKVTFISAPEGGNKSDGNAYEPLSTNARNGIQARVTEIYGLFRASVAKNRGITPQEIDAMQANVYSASQSGPVKLIDGIMSIDECLNADDNETEVQNDAADSGGSDDSGEGDDNMSVNAPEKPENSGQVAATSATSERERIKAIVGGEAAKSRPKAAQSVAFNTDMSVEAAEEFLLSLPEENAKVEAVAAAPTLDALMNATGGGAGVPANAPGSSAPGTTEMSLADQILASYAKAGGAVIEKKGS